jgi:hypothetical protein
LRQTVSRQSYTIRKPRCGAKDLVVFHAQGLGDSGKDTHCGALSGAVMALSYAFRRKRDEFNRRCKMMKAILVSRELEKKIIIIYDTCRYHESSSVALLTS